MELTFPFSTSNERMDILEAGGRPHAGPEGRLHSERRLNQTKEQKEKRKGLIEPVVDSWTRQGSALSSTNKNFEFKLTAEQKKRRLFTECACNSTDNQESIIYIV